MKTFLDNPEFRAHYAPDESPDLPYQAQWLYDRTQNADGYERGGWYATEADAIAGAKWGKRNLEAMDKIAGLDKE